MNSYSFIVVFVFLISLCIFFFPRLIGIAPPKPLTQHPSQQQQQQQRQHQHLSKKRTSIDITKPVVSQDLRVPSFETLRKLQQLRCSAFPPHTSRSSPSAVTSSAGRRRAAAHLQQAQAQSQAPPSSPSSASRPLVRQQQQQQQPSQSHSPFHDPVHEQTKKHQQHNLQPHQPHRYHEIREEERVKECQSPPSPPPQQQEEQQLPYLNQNQDLLAHALQTEGASPLPSSSPSSSSSSSPSLRHEGRGGSSVSGSGSVVIPVYHGSNTVKDEFLKTDTVSEAFSKSTVSGGGGGGGGGLRGSKTDVTEYSDSDSDSDIVSNAHNQEYNVSDDNKLDDPSALTASDSDDDSSESSVSTSVSASVVDLDVRHGGNITINQDRRVHTLDQHATDRPPQRRHDNNSNDESSTTSPALSDAQDGTAPLRWEDVNESLSYVKVDKEEPKVVLRAWEEQGQGQGQGHGVGVMTGRGRTELPVETQQQRQTQQGEGGRQKENTQGRESNLYNGSSNHESSHSTHAQHENDRTCHPSSRLRDPYSLLPNNQNNYNKDDKYNNYKNYMRRGTNKAYEPPRDSGAGATLDLSGLSFEVSTD